MHIQFNTEELTQLDRKVLALLAGVDDPAPEKAAAPAPEKAASPAKKASPPKAAAPAPAPVEEPESAAEEEAPAADGEPTLDDAIAIAAKMISDGKSAQVKAALADVGAKRVSGIDADQIGTFLAALA